MKMVQSSIALACLLAAGVDAFAAMPDETPGPETPGPEPEPPVDPFASGECVDLDDFTLGIVGADCAGAAAFCTGDFEALVGPLCPVTCGKCDDWCTDQDSMMALWATQNAGWPETCAAAGETHFEDGIYRVACGASSDKCPPVDPLASGECVNLDDSILGIVGADCAGAAAYCTGDFEALVGPLCPVTCGKCDDWCTDQDSMMALWATQNAGWPETCAAAGETHFEDGIYRVACGASSNKCSAGGRRSLSALKAIKVLTNSGSFKIKK